VQLSADEFLDQLGRRWVKEAVAEVDRVARQVLPPEAEPSWNAIRDAFGAPGAARVLRWCRRAALAQEVGRSVMFCDGLKVALMAFALLALGEDERVLREPAAFQLGTRRLEALIACRTVPASRVRERARQRAEVLANQGTIGARATFLTAGSIVGPLDDDPDPQLDVSVGETARDDLVVGASGVRLSFLRADAILGVAA
jgi:hypothetical protein